MSNVAAESRRYPDRRAGADPLGRGTPDRELAAGDPPVADPANGTTPDVEIDVGPAGNHLSFDPDWVEVPPGTTIRWTWGTDDHNIDVERQPEGADWDGTAGGPDVTYDRGHEHVHTFDTLGLYRYVCSTHEAAGMSGTVRVVEDPASPSIAWGEYLPEDPRLLIGPAALGLALLWVAYLVRGWRGDGGESP